MEDRQKNDNPYLQIAARTAKFSTIFPLFETNKIASEKRHFYRHAEPNGTEQNKELKQGKQKRWELVRSKLLSEIPDCQ